MFVSSEAVPFSKSGGLADVSGALPKALAEKGHDVMVVMPRYWCVGKEDKKILLGSMGVPMGRETVWCSVLTGIVNRVRYCFIEHEGYFGRAGLYDDGKWEYHDNAERFGFFSKAAIQLCKDTDFRPDIIHCNDWQTALIPVYLKIAEKMDPFFSKTASVFTIHNIGHQGVFPREKYSFLGLGENNFTETKFESWGKVHFMKGGIFYADAITTVSPSYAEEILTPGGGTGLAPYLERRAEDITGILNGADYDSWDPSKDGLIPKKYSVEDLSGKAECKRALQAEFGLEIVPEVPVIGMVTRLAQQKGLDLVAPVIRDIVRNMIAQIVILGSGAKEMEDFFGYLPAEFPGKIGAWIGFDERKAHLIEAGSDLFLMPSRYEPCGLNQIYSLRYGTLPIVREIGGLKDTVEQYNETNGEGTGFRFLKAEPSAVYYAVGWAVSTFYDRRDHFEAMRRRAMKKVFCWNDSVVKYEEVYRKAGERRAGWK
ncbi:MAG: glycogen synthase GlgA [Candidatus Omnitrophota bacterium]